jgi:hypothetical protein
VLTLDDGSGGAYLSASADELRALNGSRTLLRYANDRKARAAVYYARRRGGGTVVFGFPFEVITGSDTRRDVMNAVLGLLSVRSSIDKQGKASKDKENRRAVPDSGKGS